MGLLTHANRSFWVPESEVSYCKECGVEFGITTRKHHCRCCGDVVCSKCSSQRVPVIPAREIENFNYHVKNKRVCNSCSKTYVAVRLGGAPCEYLVGGKVEEKSKYVITRYESSVGSIYKQGLTGQRKWVRSFEYARCAQIDCGLCLKPLSGQVSQFCTRKFRATCHHVMHFRCALVHDTTNKGKYCPCCCISYDLIKYRDAPSSDSDSNDSDGSLADTENGVSYFLVDEKRRAVFRIPRTLAVGIRNIRL